MKKILKKLREITPNLPPLNVRVLETYKHLYPFPYYVSYKGANAETAINIMYCVIIIVILLVKN